MGGGGAGLADRLGGKAGHVRSCAFRKRKISRCFFVALGSVLAADALGVTPYNLCAGQVLLPRLQAAGARFEEHGATS